MTEEQEEVIKVKCTKNGQTEYERLIYRGQLNFVSKLANKRGAEIVVISDDNLEALKRLGD